MTRNKQHQYSQQFEVKDKINLEQVVNSEINSNLDKLSDIKIIIKDKEITRKEIENKHHDLFEDILPICEVEEENVIEETDPVEIS